MSFVFFLISGLGSTLLDLLLFSSLTLFLDKNLSYVASYSLCICARYLFDSRVTFAAATRESEGSRFLHYFAGNLAVMVFGLAVYNLLLLLPLAPATTQSWMLAGHSIVLPPERFAKLAAKVLSIPPVTIGGYVLMKLVVFRRTPPPSGT